MAIGDGDGDGDDNDDGWMDASRQCPVPDSYRGAA